MVEKIKKYALLGTERLPFDIGATSNPIKEYLQSNIPKDDESLLLKSITLSIYFEKNGLKLHKNFQDDTALAPAETLPYSSPFASTVWRRIQSKVLKHPFLIYFYLNKTIANNWVVTPDIAVDLLEIGTSKKNEHLQHKIIQAIGQRGQWAAQFNPKWEYILPKDNVNIFNNGKPAERLTAFRNLRRVTPNIARVLLIEKWENENLKEKKGFLEAMSIEYSLDDKEFIDKAKQEINWQEVEPALSIFQTPTQLEKNIIANPKLLNNSKWEVLPLYFEWSKEFSEFMLQETYQSFQYSYFARGTSLQPWFACLYPDINIEAIPKLSDSNTQKYYWSEYCSKELSKIIELCRNIAQI